MKNYKKWMEQKLTSEDMDKLPKVQKPITFEELQKIISNQGWRSGAGTTEMFMPIIRAVEEHHGIK